MPPNSKVGHTAITQPPCMLGRELNNGHSPLPANQILSYISQVYDRPSGEQIILGNFIIGRNGQFKLITSEGLHGTTGQFVQHSCTEVKPHKETAYIVRICFCIYLDCLLCDIV